MTLYSYCLRFDTGAAPNPFWGVCTLVICKPAIRRVARKDDWIVGLGAGKLSGQVIYTMKVTEEPKSMRDYDSFCRKSLPKKIPNWSSSKFEERVGDCIYDFSTPHRPQIRRSVHDERNREVDLGGMNALLSEHFYYFGDNPLFLRDDLRQIVHQTQGHKSRANAPYAEAFIAWIEGLVLKPNMLHGQPMLRAEIMEDPTSQSRCSTRDLDNDQGDAIC